MAFQINLIQALPGFLTKNSAGNTPPVGQALTVWDPVNNYDDGTGSTTPVTFAIPSGQPTTYTVQLALQGTCTFPQNYVGQYVIVGSLPGVGDFLNSPTFPVPPPSTSPTPILVSSFSTPAPTTAFACPVPFRYCGDVEWRIEVTGQQDIHASGDTRLELSWAKASATVGTLWVQSSILRTSLDFNGIYDIRLLRWFFPAPAEFTNQQHFDTTYPLWYMQRSVAAIWTWGNPHTDGRPQYDTTQGKAYYGMGSCGGSFNVEDWITAARPLLNCYDLAGIAQVAACLLLSGGGGEVLLPDWLFQTPNQFISPGMLYGRQDTPLPPQAPGINSPFYDSFNPPAAAYIAPDPHTAPLQQQRTGFGNHAWLEVSTAFDRVVVDLTHALNGLPDAATRDRQQYADAHCDITLYQYWPNLNRGNLTDFDSYQTAPQNANCFINNDFSLRYYITPQKQANGYQRVGVYDVNGILNPLYLDSIVMIPPPRASEVDTMMALAKNPAPPPVLVGNANLSAPAFQELIFSANPQLEHVSTSTRLAPGVTQRRLRFANAPLRENQTGTLFLTLSIFANHEHALAAFRTHLMEWSRPLPEVLRAPDSHVGSYSLASRNTLSFVRNNHFVILSLEGSSSPEPDHALALEPLAHSVDGYFVSSTLPIDSPALRTPSLDFESPLPESVKVGSKVEVKLAEHKSVNFETAQMASSDPNVLLVYGPSTAEGKMVLYAQTEGLVTLTVVAARGETLHPGWREWEVRVVD